MGAFAHIRYAAKTDIGRKRTNNEDSFGVFPDSGIFCVADGMGGGDDGEVASAATILAIEKFTKECPISDKFTYPIDGIVAGVRSAINSASSWIAKRAQQKGLKGCGSTFVGICFDAAKPNTAIALHAGDSRLYRIRGRSIEQITVDHSAAELIGAKDDKEVNPMFRGMILRAVGIQPSVELQRTEVQLKENDRILICSDGLSRMVSDKTMLTIIRACEKVETAVDNLIAAANEAGGIDNITVELIEVGAFPPPLSTSPLVSTPIADHDSILDTQSVLTETTATRATIAGTLSHNTTTEVDFIPSTAGDSDLEIAEDDLNIPESDTEDDAPNVEASVSASAAARGAEEAKRARSVRVKSILRRKLRAIVFRLLGNRYIVAGLVVALAAAGWVAGCLYTRAADEAKAKELIEARLHTKEQKDSIQTVEARRKGIEEQKVREAELERTRSEMQTHAKQLELDEKARKAAERREREEMAARENAEADAKREQEAKAQEEARQEELRKAEEAQKKAEEDARRKAEEEARRKAEEEARLAREEAERKEKERIEAERRKAEEEARRKAEEEARLAREEAERKEKERIEAERRKAEEEARRKAEEEARLAREEAERKEKERIEAARRKAEEEARRKAEEEARRKAEEEARFAREEAERKEKERIEAERRKAEEEAAAKALAAKHEKERREKEAKEKQELVISSFADVVNNGIATKFYSKVKERIPNSLPDDLHRKFSRTCNNELSKSEQLAAIVELTKDIQDLARALREYSSLTLENANSDLADAANDKRAKDFVLKIKNRVIEFEAEAKSFTNDDATSPDTQLKCIRIIRGVPNWFDF